MSKDKREGWLRELQPGHLVVVQSWDRKLTLDHVKRVTPTGQIALESSGGNFQATGQRYYFTGLSDYLLEPTEERQRVALAFLDLKRCEAILSALELQFQEKKGALWSARKSGEQKVINTKKLYYDLHQVLQKVTYSETEGEPYHPTPSPSHQDAPEGESAE